MDLLDSVLDCIRYTPMDILSDTEEWGKIPGYLTHYVSDLGRVKNTKTGRIMMQSVGKSGYRIVSLCKDGKSTTHDTHRLVAQVFLPNPDKKRCVDHINNDRLDNRLSNLRWCSYEENNRNSKTPKSNTSGFKGVSFNKNMKKFHARIQVDRKKKHLGFFDSAKDAALAYNEAAIKYFKDFARINIIK